MEQTYFQKGFGLRSEIRPQLQENYRSQIVDFMRANGYRLEADGLTFLLAMEFGFFPSRISSNGGHTDRSTFVSCNARFCSSKVGFCSVKMACANRDVP
jgi:hypothetical protein